MQQGQYILDRWMVAALRSICQDLGISFASYSDDWVIELSKSGHRHRIIGYKFDINDSVASTIAGDKVAAYQMLQKAGIPAVEHRLVKTKAGGYPEWSSGMQQIVIKPLDGTSGHGVALLQDSKQAHEYIAARPTIASWAASPYEDIVHERRFIILGGKVICTYEKFPIEIDGLKMFNLGLGAKAFVSESDTSMAQLAIDAAAVLGLGLAAVDVIQLGDTYKVLEVNDGLMMENFMRQSSEYQQIAHEVYRRVVASMFED